MTKRNLKIVVVIGSVAAVAAATFLVFILVKEKRAAESARVHAIRPPQTLLPTEAESKDITKFSFIVYGDTRDRRDGISTQYEHSRVIDSMLQKIKMLRDTEYPVKFVLQSGDAVTDGRNIAQWNLSFVPLINHLSHEGDVPYFLTPGNHEATTTKTGLKNYLNAVSELIPDASSRRLKGTATYSFAYGNTFVVALDSVNAGDDKQYEWIKKQLEELDRSRYVNVIIFCHHAPFSSGPHGGPHIEHETVELRTRYMPLFNSHHVRAVFSGHEHLYEHWVQRYRDNSGAHRMDLIVSGGGGAPIYVYTGEPDLRAYLAANIASNVQLQHLVRPGGKDSPTPHHFVVVRVDGDKLNLEVIPVEGATFAPYSKNTIELEDAPKINN